ncbi:MAG: type I-C CRISPR-associated protein Cas8c/Csd1 [Chthoniobacteraceae bacterium]
MILQALKEYYDRKAADPEDGIAPIGWEWKEIPYVIVISLEGKLVQLECTYEGSGKQRRAKAFLVPQGVKKTSGIASNLFWDNPEYALGVALKGKPERVPQQHASFKSAIEALSTSEEEGVKAVMAFLNDESKLDQLAAEGDTWKNLQDEGANLTFRLATDARPISSRPKIKAAIEAARCSGDGEDSVCLITGNHEPVAPLHTAIKGVWGAQTSGANIVSFNLDAFRSFGKEQGYNAPVGASAMFAYTTALNRLLGKDSTQRLQVGDASTVFWSARKTQLENAPVFFSEPPKDDPDQLTRAVADLLTSVQSGTYVKTDSDNRFYVLGLAPNAARIAIRFWHTGTVPEMAERFAQHFRDLEIVHGPKEPGVLSLFRLLISTAPNGKSENIPPNLAGDTMRAILEGLPFPATLLQSVIRRIRAEHEITHARAALLKASLNRSQRTNPKSEKPILPMLDLENNNIGYRLGRLFAALEKIQGEAQKSLNTTIRDRFYGAASSTPVTVFGNLMRLKNHHLPKLTPGRCVNMEKLLGEITDGISDFPAHLALADQARFALGYYHQMQTFYTKKSE